MGSVQPGIFRAYDVRGNYPEEINDDIARRLGAQLAAYLRAGTFVVGCDARPGSDSLASAVIDAAKASGAHVLDVGSVSTPQFQWAIRAREAVGGIMVTASHLPQSQNGFKAIARRGDVLEVIGGNQLRQVFDSHAAPAGSGTMTTESITDDYAAAVAYAAGWRGGTELPVSVDAPAAVQQVLERLGPIAPEVSLAARCDADGDRISFFLHGTEVPADQIFLLLTEHLKFAPVVFDLRFSKLVRERLDHAGIAYAVSRVGRLHLSLAMRERGALFGGEISGHYYWSTMGGMESPELTLLQVLKVCQRDPQRLTAMLQPYQRYAKSPEYSIPIRDRKHGDALINQLERRFAGCTMDRQDGLTVDCWNGYLSTRSEEGFWFNIRPSNTEPLLRLIIESKEKDLLQRRVAEVRGIIG